MWCNDCDHVSTVPQSQLHKQQSNLHALAITRLVVQTKTTYRRSRKHMSNRATCLP